MAVKIRLRRVGRKKQASYRIVVVDVEAPRDGAYVEAIGFYNPRRDPAELRMDLDRIDAWLSDGAQPTDTVASLIRKARKGGDDKVAFGTPGEGVEAAAASEVVAEAGEEAEEATAEAETEEQPAEASAAVETPEETAEEAEPEAPAEEPEAEAEAEEPKAAAASEPESEEEEDGSSDEEEETSAEEDEEEAPKA